jgi:N-methylhydantoinase B/oxoprolinase/acetone carboxylase alpha subunit
VTVEIVRGAIRAAQAEMEALIERTAISAFIREKKDFYTALFDADGVMAVGSNVPVFGDMTSPVFAHFPKERMKPAISTGTTIAMDRAGRFPIRTIRCLSHRYFTMGCFARS